MHAEDLTRPSPRACSDSIKVGALQHVDAVPRVVSFPLVFELVDVFTAKGIVPARRFAGQAGKERMSVGAA